MTAPNEHDDDPKMLPSTEALLQRLEARARRRQRALEWFLIGSLVLAVPLMLLGSARALFGVMATFPLGLIALSGAMGAWGILYGVLLWALGSGACVMIGGLAKALIFRDAKRHEPTALSTLLTMMVFWGFAYAYICWVP